MANIEIKGANTFPTLHFSRGGTAVRLQAAVRTSERVSTRTSQLFIEWLIYVGFIWCILKAQGGTGKRKMVYVTAINWDPLSFLSEYTKSHG